MQFSTARKEVAAQLGLDETQSSIITLINRWLNLAQNTISSLWTWSWLEDREIVVTQTDLTTGTVNVSAAATSITFSSAPATSQANRFIQFSSADDWYEITDHTAASTSATISPAYAQTSDLTAGTFTVRTFYYTLASTTEHVYNCKRSGDGNAYIPLISADLYDKYEPFTTATGSPEKIIMWKRDSSGSIQFTPYPFPDSKLLLEFRVYKKPTDLSADSDTPLFPNKFDSIWIEGATARGYKFLDDDREKSTKNDFFDKIEAMKKFDNPALDESRILKSIDEGGQRNFLRFPSNYGEVHQ